MLRQRLNERDFYAPHYTSTPKTHVPKKEPQPVLSEWRLAFAGLVISILIITAKLYYAYRESIIKFMLERHLVSYEVLLTDGDIVYGHAWKTAVKYSNIWLPALCGILTTYFTWVMVYLDSNVPGVQPPSPFSPTKYKVVSGHTFHLNYVFAVMIGILVFFYTYWKGLSIEY